MFFLVISIKVTVADMDWAWRKLSTKYGKYCECNFVLCFEGGEREGTNWFDTSKMNHLTAIPFQMDFFRCKRAENDVYIGDFITFEQFVYVNIFLRYFVYYGTEEHDLVIYSSQIWSWYKIVFFCAVIHKALASFTVQSKNITNFRQLWNFQ